MPLSVLSATIMNQLSAKLTKPEEVELEKKKNELSQLESELADRELYLMALRLEFASFERSYLEIVGTRYTELDELEAELAERRASAFPKDQQAQEAAVHARSQATASRAAVDSAVQDGPASRTSPRSQAFKSLYREVARRIHPDLATDSADRARRERLMAEANKAYEEGDEAHLRGILQEYEAAPESVTGEGTAADLVRVIRKIAQVKKRLAQIENELHALNKSQILQLKSRADQAANNGRDLLREMAEELDLQISISREALEKLSAKRS